MTPPLRERIAAGLRDEAKIMAAHALDRLPTPEDIANAIAYLCSEGARAITGVTPPVEFIRWFTSQPPVPAEGFISKTQTHPADGAQLPPGLSGFHVGGNPGCETMIAVEHWTSAEAFRAYVPCSFRRTGPVRARRQRGRRPAHNPPR